MSLVARALAVPATGWSAVEVLARQSAHFIIAVVLARILSPEEFGVYALLALFTGVAGILIDSGTGSALIHKQDATPEDETAIFWFNLLVATLVASILVAAAPALARFYEVPTLQIVGYVMALNLVVTAMGNIHRILLAKNLLFRRLTIISFSTVVVSGCIAIVLGIAGYGVMALALQALAGGIVGTILLWSLNDWRPKQNLEINSLRRLITYGRYWLGIQLLNLFHARLNTVLIGRFHDPEVLGHYIRGETTSALPATMVSSIFERVAFPALSSLSSEPEHFRRRLKATLRTAMLINAPVILGLLVVADPFVVTVFGERWMPAVPYLQILCLSRLFIPVYDINLLVFMATGRPRDFFIFECLTKPFCLFLTICAAIISVEAIAWSLVISAWSTSILIAGKAGRVVNYGFKSQMRDLVPCIWPAIIMAGAVWMISPTIAGLPAAIRLLLEIAAGIFIFGGLAISFNPLAVQNLRKVLSRHHDKALQELP